MRAWSLTARPPRSRRRLALLGVALWAASLVHAQPPRAEVIERVLAVVNGRPVMLSEVRGFVELGLIEAAGPEPWADALTRIIDRRLVLGEVERYPLAPPPPSAVESEMAAIAARFPTSEAFRGALERAGFTEARLREIVQDNLRIARYLAERFGSVEPPTDEEVRRYYGDHQAAFTVDGRLRPFDEVRDLARQRLMAERQRSLIEAWVADLRRRADIVRLDRPDPR